MGMVREYEDGYTPDVEEIDGHIGTDLGPEEIPPEEIPEEDEEDLDEEA